MRKKITNTDLFTFEGDGIKVKLDNDISKWWIPLVFFWNGILFLTWSIIVIPLMLLISITDKFEKNKRKIRRENRRLEVG